ncbi:MAG: lipopolysaccharide heptosyltransferase I [Gammaproteobacteria bacterium]|nr:lipopolysaccharide heptosyltransferase I [Gammaproteobacteria bacterium]MDP2140128.1 lipopolysaccharide heptosyltransferase I [Gammaproteobacteria bacterium]MDP2346486.1 lipopolysaccharide heptosyltransferase I [Gammaproteobacteria bacterium]
MRVLIVKVSSLGDIIHTLPAVTDAKNANRRLQFDWVVEESFAEVPAWHPGVERVIPVAFRRWRKGIFSALRSGEFAAFNEDLKQTHYDLVIDAQGLIKSGIISRLSRGLTIGLSNSTVKEPLATLFYNKRISVPREEHAVQRVRELFSRALNYPLLPANMESIDYGLNLARIGVTENLQDSGMLVFLHGTTWQSKHWPEPYWRELARLATAHGYTVRLPWGNDNERKRAHAIADGIAGVSVLERQTLTGMAQQIALADGVIGVDTGLGHLAAALATPTLTLYGPTNPGLAGTFGRHQARLSSTLPCAPCMSKTCHYEGPAITDSVTTDSGDSKEFTVRPPCFSSNPPAQALAALEQVMAQRKRSIRIA